AAIDHRVSWFNARGSALETFNLDVLGNADWQYFHLVRRGDAQNKRFHISPSAGLRGGWTLGAGVFWETYGYDTQLYGNYRIEHTLAGRNAIPRLKVEYQFTRSIFLRAVTEYSLSERNDLRDETRTFFPLIINGKKALATRTAGFKEDLLFSYQPNPGTVLFL